jgi:streptogramin lyase
LAVGAVLAVALLAAGSAWADGTIGSLTSFTGPGINEPERVAWGPDGALWFTNYGNNSVGRVSTAGVVSNFTDPSIKGPAGITAGSDGAMWFTNSTGTTVDRITTAGVVTSYSGPGIIRPASITSGPDGALWFTNLDGWIGRITTSGVVTGFLKTSLGGTPYGITTGPDGALWFTTGSPSSIGRMTTAGAVHQYTGGDIDGVAGSIVAAPDGALWFAEANAGLGRITTAGVVLSSFSPPVTGPDARWPMSLTAGPDGAVWFTSHYSSADIFSISMSGTFTAYPTNTSGPLGITTGADGAVWFTGWTDNSINRVQAANGPPSAPDAPSAKAGNASATVTWAPPAVTGGGGITGYTITASPGGQHCTWSTGPLSCVVTGLTNNTAYTFTVTATNIDGTSGASPPSNAITPAPVTVTSTQPNSGIPAGGATITLKGTGFSAATAVRFGSTAAPTFTVVDDSTLTVTSPPRSLGLVNIFVQTPTGTNTSGPSSWFNYVSGPSAPPTISSITPNAGSTTGGTTITITGTGLLTTSAVRFGPATPAASFSVMSDTSLQVTTPANPSQLVNVWITNNIGTSASGQTSRYYFRTVSGPAPTVTAVTPNTGPAAGGQTTTITGTGFTSATQVRFGTTTAPFTVVNDTTITATTPAHGAGLVNVLVATGNGTSTSGQPDWYSFQ